VTGGRLAVTCAFVSNELRTRAGCEPNARSASCDARSDSKSSASRSSRLRLSLSSWRDVAAAAGGRTVFATGAFFSALLDVDAFAPSEARGGPFVSRFFPPGGGAPRGVPRNLRMSAFSSRPSNRSSSESESGAVVFAVVFAVMFAVLAPACSGSVAPTRRFSGDGADIFSEKSLTTGDSAESSTAIVVVVVGGGGVVVGESTSGASPTPYSPSFALVAAFSLARDARSRSASAVDETGFDETGLAPDRVASPRFSADGFLVRDGSSDRAGVRSTVTAGRFAVASRAATGLGDDAYFRYAARNCRSKSFAGSGAAGDDVFGVTVDVTVGSSAAGRSVPCPGAFSALRNASMNVASTPPRSAVLFSSSAATTAAALRIRTRSAASLAALSLRSDRRMFSAASTYAAEGVAPFLPSGVEPNRIGDPDVEGSSPTAAGGVLVAVLTGVARGGARRRGSGVTDRRGSGFEGDAPRSSTRGLLYPLGRQDGGVGGDPRHGAAVDLARAAAAYLDSTAE